MPAPIVVNGGVVEVHKKHDCCYCYTLGHVSAPLLKAKEFTFETNPMWHTTDVKLSAWETSGLLSS